MFNLEDEIKRWLRKFRRYRAFSHGSVREMELHLRDHIDDLKTAGHTDKQAFQMAIREFGEIKPMAKEEFLNLKPASTSLIHTHMLNNYLKIALRNFWNHKFYALVNVFGLTLGLSIVFMIGLFVGDELSFDRFHIKKDRLYRVVENQYYDGQPVFPVAVTPVALGPAIAQQYPEITAFTRISGQSDRFLKDGEMILENDGAYVDSYFFEMFSFPLVSGSVENFKDQINALVINEELAQKYFPDKDPVGELLRLGEEEHTVVAVIKDFPLNSHLSFRYLRNFENLLVRNPDLADDWGSNRLYTYVETASGVDPEAVNEKIIGLIKANNENSVTDIYLQPLTDIYLGTVDFTVEVSRKGVMMYVQIFSAVALFILLISCINFMNLSTARSAKRAREVGLRKTVGANRRQLVVQFLSESVLLTLTAVVLSVILVVLLLPAFNQLSGKQFQWQVLISAEHGIKLFAGVVTMAVLTGLVAGSYPAIYLSAIRPVRTLGSNMDKGKEGSGFRKTLVVLQFSISIVLIIGTTVVYQQFRFIQNANLGYNRDNIIYTFAQRDKAGAFTNDIRAQSSVINAGLANRHPGYVMSSTSGFQWPGQNPDETILIHYMAMDEHYMPTMEMKMADGRGFVQTDSLAVIINETAQEVMKLQDPVGQVITGGQSEYTIVGVVEDFNFKSIHTPVEPLVIFKSSGLNRVFIKYDPAEEKNIVATLEGIWSRHFPDREFDYYFLDTDFDEMYAAEQRTRTLSTCFAVLAILISCLGLFGLVSYATEQRRKEIGIRKVMGATVSSLFMLLTSDFTRLVLVSLLIAMPVGWYAMDQWLENFAYRTGISPWIFILSAASALSIAVITVSYQSIRASTRNPVHALRNE